MSKNTITIDHKYNTTQRNYNLSIDSPITQYSFGFPLDRESGISFKSMFQPLMMAIPYDFQSLLLGVVFFLFCTFTGFLSALYVLRDKPQIKRAYQELRTFNTQTPGSVEGVSKLSRKIETLKIEPNLFGFPTRLFLGLSFLIFKIRIANWCRCFQSKCIVEGNNDFKEVFSKHTEITEKKAFDLIPE